MAKKQLLRAFVLMPFREELDWAYEKLVKPAFEAAAYEVIRADDIDSQQSILKDIVTAIVASDVVIADLTGANPNVYYELGLSHALKKQVVLLSQDVSAAPFDLRSYRIIEYGARFDKFESTQIRLTALAHDISKGRVRFGNPVSDFVQREDGGPEKTGTADEKASTDPDETVKAGVEDEDEPGVLDLVYETEKGFGEQKELLAEATKQIKLLGEYATETTPRIEALTEARNYVGLRKLFRDLSSLYDDRTADLHDINDKLRLSWEHTSSALEKRFYHSTINLKTRREMLRVTREMCSKANEAQTAMASFRQKVDALPNIDRVLTRSKRNLVKELGGLVAFTEDVAAFEGRLTGVLEEATNE